MPLRFLHTSDIHLLDLQGARPWNYLNKRITGRVNLALRRGRNHDGRLFDAMMSQLPALAVDRVVVTGDLVNLSLPSEFAHVRDKLEGLPVPVTVIPGNHDAYVASVTRNRVFEQFFGAHMQGERFDDADYPFMARFDGVALIGVSTAVATAPFSATGRIGEAQLRRLGRMLGLAKREGRVAVVLIHHPPVAGIARRGHHLIDQPALAELVAQHEAALFLHGHEHRRIESQLAAAAGLVPVHGVASGTSLSARPGREACFSVYDVSAGSIERELFVRDGATFAPTGPRPP